MIPARTVIDLFVKRPKMSEFVHQRLEAVALGVAANQNALAIVERHAAYTSAEHLLDYGLANHIDSPAWRHWIGPNA